MDTLEALNANALTQLQHTVYSLYLAQGVLRQHGYTDAGNDIDTLLVELEPLRDALNDEYRW